ncbi:arsenate reductase ArsC [Candidatus Margulisiibacteriota bacterium]
MNKKKVLFLCTGNSCRSQMAEGLLRNCAGDRFEVFSAGILKTFVHPFAIKVMAEKGIDLSQQYSKTTEEFTGVEFDYLITLCNHARQTCPAYFTRKERLHWGIEDPAGFEGTENEKVIVFRKARDAIARRIKEFINVENS